MWNLNDPKSLLWALVPLGLALFFAFRRRKSGARLVAFSLPGGELKRELKKTRWIFRGVFALLLSAFALLVIVIAQPFQLESWSKKTTEGIDIMLVFDVSESMEATDLVPNRMSAAKDVIHRFVRNRPNDRIGLVIFGGESVTKCPLTRDHDFLHTMVDDSRMRELKQGTAIGMGLSSGISRLRTSESKTKVMVLITDGDSNVGSVNPITAAHLARQEGIKIYSVGIGKENRVVVPIYAYDMFGRKTQLIAQVPSYINPELLAQISHLTGGKAYMARDTGMLHRILQEIDRLEKTKLKIQPLQRKNELFLPFAALATLILFLIYCLQETRFRKAAVRHALPV